MYQGQIDVISNKATWISKYFELVDEEDDTTTDLSDPALDADVEVTIRDSCENILATANVANGKMTIPGPGFEWRFEDTDLSGICAGTYIAGAKITYTANGVTNIVDLIIGTLAIVRGNP